MEEIYIYGRKPVIAALRANAAIAKVYIAYGAKGQEIDQIYTLAKKNKIPLTQYDNKKFNKLINENKLNKENHQGVVALRQLAQPIPLFQLLDEALIEDPVPLIIFLDGIQDPHNLGSVARTAEAAGVQGLIITENESSPITPVAFKISAGALEYIPVSFVKNLTQAFKTFKERGFTTIATDPNAELLYTEVQIKQPTILIIGSEGKGLSPQVKKMADQFVKIPIYGKTESLNASVAAGIVIYEIIKNKNKL